VVGARLQSKTSNTEADFRCFTLHSALKGQAECGARIFRRLAGICAIYQADQSRELLLSRTLTGSARASVDVGAGEHKTQIRRTDAIVLFASASGGMRHFYLTLFDQEICARKFCEQSIFHLVFPNQSGKVIFYNGVMRHPRTPTFSPWRKNASFLLSIALIEFTVI